MLVVEMVIVQPVYVTVPRASRELIVVLELKIRISTISPLLVRVVMDYLMVP